MNTDLEYQWLVMEGNNWDDIARLIDSPVACMFRCFVLLAFSLLTCLSFYLSACLPFCLSICLFA